MSYKIYRSTNPNEQGQLVNTVETFPVTMDGLPDGKNYVRISEINDHGEGATTNPIEVVSVAAAGVLNIQNGIERVTISGTMPVGADNCVIQADITGSGNWVTQQSNVSTSYVVLDPAKLYTKWRYRGIYGSKSTGNLSQEYTYTNPMTVVPVLQMTQNANYTLTFTFTGDPNTIEAKLMRQNYGAVETFNLDTKSITTNVPNIDSTYYVETICGLKKLQSNTIFVDGKAPTRTLEAVIHPITQSSILVTWLPPLNIVYTGTRVSWTSPTGVTGTYDVPKSSLEYNIPITEAGIWQIRAEAIYADGVSIALTTQITTILASVTNLVVSAPQKNYFKVTWTTPVNTNYTDYRIRYKLNTDSTWNYTTVAKSFTSIDIPILVSGTYQVNIAARYGTALTESWTATDKTITAIVETQGSSVGMFPFSVSKELAGGDTSPIADTAIIPNLNIPNGYYYKVTIADISFNSYTLGEVLDMANEPDKSEFALASQYGDEYNENGLVDRAGEGIVPEFSGTFFWNKMMDTVDMNIYGATTYDKWVHNEPAVGFVLPISDIYGRYYSYYFWDSINVTGTVEVFDDNPLGLFTFKIIGGATAQLRWTGSSLATSYEVYRNDVLYTTVPYFDPHSSHTIQIPSEISGTTFFVRAICGNISRDSDTLEYVKEITLTEADLPYTVPDWSGFVGYSVTLTGVKGNYADLQVWYQEPSYTPQMLTSLRLNGSNASDSKESLSSNINIYTNYRLYYTISGDYTSFDISIKLR